MREFPNLHLSRTFTLLTSFLCALVLLASCASSTPSTYADWKAMQEVKAQAAKMLKAAEGTVFKPAGTK
jgi:hypothetical protein